jgi:LAO/AO transport system kinase
MVIDMADSQFVQRLQERLLAGDRLALARAITLVENGDPEARSLLASLYLHTGNAHIIGVTGPPGCGKSTLVNAITKIYRSEGLTVGVVAVDPTSPFSGGALLGDRIRMRDLAGDPGVFIRSMATRGSLGGLARATADVVQVLDAAGFDRVIVETVGVGQAEVEVASATHTVVVVVAPGMGDDVQANKAGILEIADVFAVNKADRDGADHAEMALRMMQELGRTVSPDSNTAENDWQPPIIKTVATEGMGIGEVVTAVGDHSSHLHSTHLFEKRERARLRRELESILQHEVLDRMRSRIASDQQEHLLDMIVERKLDPYSAAERYLAAGGME